MPRKSPEVDAYIERSEPFARPILKKLRRLFLQAAPEVTEALKWGVPYFEYKGLVGGMAGFKRHVGFGFWKSKLMRDPEGLFRGDPKASMCSLKFSSLKDLPSNDVIQAYVREAVRLNEEEVAAPRRKSVRKGPPQVPPDLQARLRRNAAARRTFEALSPGHQREYIEWIEEAKQEATRARRLVTTVEWLSEGKRRNWKYQR